MSADREVVVLVHGLWMHGLVMTVQRYFLERMGFSTVCYSYPSVRLTLTENVARLAKFARALAVPQIHWVGHSLGGLVILGMLDRERAMPPGRVVLMGTPYGGTQSGRAMQRNFMGARALGHSMAEWLDAPWPQHFPGRQIGVIAGNSGMGMGRVVARSLTVPNDGTVAVIETELSAACDHIELPVSHMSMLLSRAVARQTGNFLRDGRFDHAVKES